MKSVDAVRIAVIADHVVGSSSLWESKTVVLQFALQNGNRVRGIAAMALRNGNLCIEASAPSVPSVRIEGTPDVPSIGVA